MSDYFHNVSGWKDLLLLPLWRWENWWIKHSWSVYKSSHVSLNKINDLLFRVRWSISQITKVARASWCANCFHRLNLSKSSYLQICQNRPAGSERALRCLNDKNAEKHERPEEVSETETETRRQDAGTSRVKSAECGLMRGPATRGKEAVWVIEFRSGSTAMSH